MKRLFFFPVAIAALVGCGPEMGALEAVAALEQSARSSSGDDATTEPIEVSTDFTIGAGLEDAAAELAALWDSQAPCNEVVRDGNTLTVDWGELSDGCVYDGHTYAGITELTVEKTDSEELEVLHEWIGFHNEDVAVDGGASVTWSAADSTRHVVTRHTFTDGEGSVDVDGDHLLSRLDEGVFALEGTRDWTTDGRDWHLDMTDIQFRLMDPAPEAGSYVVTNPDGKTLELAFERLDEDTIQATLIGLRGGDRTYAIGRGGQIDGAGER